MGSFVLLRIGYRTAGILYLMLAVCIAMWFVLGEKVIAPHVQDLELGLPAGKIAQIQNRKFNDYFLNYIPELQQQISGPRSGWIATWSGLNELGRPLYHTEGLSPAYAPTWLLTRISSDPYVVITALVLFTAFASGTFAFLLAREWGLHPLASLSAAVLMASTPMTTYWATFPMYLAVYCWATGLMYGFQRSVRRQDSLGWLTLSFCAYALLMTAYPQMTVQHAYLLATWSLSVLWRVARERGARSTAILMVHAGSAVSAGILLALPVFLDLWIIARESARLDVPLDFYTALFPAHDTWQKTVEWLVTMTAPDLFGNPSAPDFPFVYNGRSVVAWVWLLAVASIPLCLRRVWGWWLAVGVCILLVLHKPLYHFCVTYLGFGLSRSNPLAVAVLPMIWLAATALDRLLRRAQALADKQATAGLIRAAWFFPMLACIVTLACAFALAQASGQNIRGERLLILALSAASCAALWTRYAGLAAITGAAIAMFAYGGPMVLTQELAAIHRTSPLLDAVRSHLLPGERYAWVSEPTSLPPNANATAGIATLHTYDSLSPKSYHVLIEELGGEMQVFGRHNNWIAPPENSIQLQLANIRLFLSSQPLSTIYGSPLDVVAGIGIYENKQRMGGWVNLPLEEAIADGGGYRVTRLSNAAQLNAEPLGNSGDTLEFSLSGTMPSLFVLSQKYHRQWVAEWRSGDEWKGAATVRVNGFYQGVVLPPGATDVRLRFLPWARYAWSAHLFFGLTGLLVLMRLVWKSRESLRSSGKPKLPI